MALTDTAKELLNDMFLIYWQWNIKPELDNPAVNSPEYFVIDMYERMKNDALIKYPWRSATRYVDLVPTPPAVSGDGRYKYEIDVPEDFLLATGFWQDKERRLSSQNSVDIVGKKARTNLSKFTMSYIASGIDEVEFDPWLIDYLKIYIAAEAADIGGQTPDRKNFLLESVEIGLMRAGNKDYEMAQKDEISSSIHQFEWY